MARVTCKDCGAKSIVTSRETQTAGVSHLYCSCTNTKECGATFRVTLSFDHYLNPPLKSTRELAVELLSKLPKEEQLELVGM
ncbi:ogr/Delta-like zinc finger family protein [Pseudoalteromonas sp. CNC9-20]|uniref:ogr/Delta-like zinc finger family protein n=1 Tax=Pseudoalteromonas sp. CNC9-20 TaxID=2917750 RepID=UPI001EF52A08|nr:ogr/Delta-like zinc finger family protein [Pseudoalteromonas sp. CNC9-20]MCG7570535.1 ogr/Delta-like zinc finger family protein [Pseudoalteromonas sp. CNC9-20]